MVADLLRYELPETFLLKTEISELRIAGGGHCYLSFVEPSADGNGLAAKASAHIWRAAWPALRAKFERATGQPLRAGLQVLVEVEVDFHALYGYSLNVVDIDPSYTLGDAARRRREILDRLQADGVADMNRELPLPRLLRRIAVISSPTAAGLGDFENQLANSGFTFSLTLFEAVVQGASTAASVIAALGRIARREADFDCVVLVRGGGAVSDLQGFESYELASHVAQFPLPVFTGIGHERDDTVVDFVAHTRLKTPTACAEFLVESRRRELRLLGELSTRLSAEAKARLSATNLHLAQLRLRLDHTAARAIELRRKELENQEQRLRTTAAQTLLGARHRLVMLDERAATRASGLLTAARNRMALLKKSIDAADPKHILRLGYSIVCHETGSAVRDARSLKKGALLRIRFARGEATAAVRTISNSTDHEE